MRRQLPLARWRDIVPPERGLTSAEVKERERIYGLNEIVEAVGSPWRDLARDTAKDPMLWFLVGTGVLYLLVGQYTEGLTLLAATAPLVGMDAFLHRRTQASTESLKSRLAARAIVIRDQQPAEVPAVALVPGDLVVVDTGEPFPADGVVTEGAELQADESALTGESYPVRKHPLTGPYTDGPEPPIEAEHWGFAGTRLLTGRATMRLVFTGAETFYGEIVRSATTGGRARTPLQHAIGNLVSLLIAGATLMCAVLAAVRLRQGYGWVDALVSAVTLAAAALPEEFPVAFTFFLGVGVYRLAKRHTLVRRAVTVENIGRVSSICSDKTGTITEGSLHLTHLLPADSVGRERLLGLAATASREQTGDPLDRAILKQARGVPPIAGEVVATFPFTEGRKRETAIVRGAEGPLAATKGAAELVIAMCTLGETERQIRLRQVSDLAAGGHKVIAVASRAVEAGAEAAEPQQGYGFAGLLAFEDPVREGVPQAIAACRHAGIRVVMITGDHPLAARAVAREIGLGADEPVVIMGDEMERSLAAGAPDGVVRCDAIARAVPRQKLALVRALQQAGETVAVTGDGVNDVPALQAADIGIAMGERGTRSAREAAAIVLLDDNFRTVVQAIHEGRQLFRNLQLSFQYLLMIHIPLVITAALIPLVGYPLLYLPVHIVWLEMIIHPTAMLVFQQLPANEPQLPHRRGHGGRFFEGRDWTVIALVGALVTLTVWLGYWHGLDGGTERARSLALVTLTSASAALTAVLSRLRTPMAWFICLAGLGASLLLVQEPSLATLLHLLPLSLHDWAAALAAAMLAASIPLALGRAGERRHTDMPATGAAPAH